MLYKTTGNEHRLDLLEMTWKGMFKRVWTIQLRYSMDCLFAHMPRGPCKFSDPGTVKRSLGLTVHLVLSL